MGRHKMYDKWEIPKTVVDIVKTVCADYYRRERGIKYESITGSQLQEYIRLNALIDNVMDLVDVGVRTDMLKDIGAKRGYKTTAIRSMMAKNTYYGTKKMVIYHIALGLHLIKEKGCL